MPSFDHAILLAMSLAACGGTADGQGPVDSAPGEFACELGEIDEDGVFISFDEDDRAELVLGFQGFLFLQTHVTSDQLTASDTAMATTSIYLDSGETGGGTQADVGVSAEAMTEEILMFLPTANIALYNGQEAELAVRLEVGDRFCVTTSKVILADDDPCIHTDDEPICPDDEETG